MSDISFGKIPIEMKNTCSGAHIFEWIASDYLYHIKGNRDRIWFKGKYAYCTKPGCTATKFMGELAPYFKDKDGDPGPDDVMIKKGEIKNES